VDDVALDRLGDEFLALLIDGQESLPQLLANLVDLELAPETLVSEVLEALDRLERDGLVEVVYWGGDQPVGRPPRKPTRHELDLERSRFPNLSAAASEPWKFIGLWYRITPSGRVRWESEVGPKRGSEKQWTIEDRTAEGLVIVQAPDDNIALKAVQDWQRSNPDERVAPEPERVERDVTYDLRDGTRINGGVRLIFRKRPRGVPAQ
jgi:hypothetical protein